MSNEIENKIPADALLTVEDLAVRLKVKRSWVYTHADDLGAYRLGKYVRFDWARVIGRLQLVARGPQLGRQPSDPS